MPCLRMCRDRGRAGGAPATPTAVFPSAERGGDASSGAAASGHQAPVLQRLFRHQMANSRHSAQAMGKPYHVPMKRAIVLLAAALLLLSCGSSKPAAPERVHMDIVQLTGLAASQTPGPFDVQLGIEVQNL